MPDLTTALSRHADTWHGRRVLGGAVGPYVEVNGKRVLSFCGSDYLGLASDVQIGETLGRAAARFGAGAGGPPMSVGHGVVHQRLEQALASFAGCEAALHFAEEHLMHTDLIRSLVGKGDAIFVDEYTQPSLFDGARLSGAKVESYSHGDMAHLEFALSSSTAPTKMILSDSVFGLTGGLAPLDQLVMLCERYDAWLLLNDSHGLGWLGPDGRGAGHIAFSPNLVYSASLAHSAAIGGAFVAGSANLISWLLRSLRGYALACALSPALMAATVIGLQRIQAEGTRRERLRHLVEEFQARMRGSAVHLLPSDSPIQVVLLGDARGAHQMAQSLFETGIWVQALQPPMVPSGVAQIRISLCAGHAVEDIERLAHGLSAAAGKGRDSTALSQPA